MGDLHIFPSQLRGKISVAASKSHTLRAFLFAMLAKGKSFISNPLLSIDTQKMLQAISQFGAKVTSKENVIEIEGGFFSPKESIDAGNSGQILRFIGGVASLLSTPCEITGDHSVQTRRPILPLLNALEELGAKAKSLKGTGYAPISIQGPISPGMCHLPGEDSQPVSALLMATSFLEGPSEIFVENPGETPWINVTLDWLKRLGAEVICDQYHHYHVKGGLTYQEIHYQVPGDFSSAAYPIAAALITHSELEIYGLDCQDIQGDKILIELLKQMGGKIFWKKDVLVIEPSPLKGIDIDVNQCIDALPILAVLGCFSEGKTRLYNARIARKKESDRISAISNELKKMGAKITELPDGLIIEQSKLSGANLLSHHDHRIALSLCVAALGATGHSSLVEPERIKKSYPHFVEDFQKIGANIELDPVWV